MSNIQISDHVRYIGVDDKTIQLFESQYDVPNGVSYNSYLILDDKIAVMDTVDARATEEWLTWRPLWMAEPPITWWSSTWSRTTRPASTGRRRSTRRCRLWATPKPSP